MKRVLTIDDSRSLRSIVKKALKTLEEVEIFEAEDGQQGLAAVEECQPDLILLDVTMPVMDGPATIKELRARGSNVPVILLTAESKLSIIAPMMKEGFQDYIVKPFQPEELVKKVVKILQTKVESSSKGAFDSDIYNSGSGELDVSIKSDFAPTKSWVDIYESAVDVLLIDDMDHVAKRFREFLPDHITMKNSLEPQSAISFCRRHAFRVIVIDLEMPNVNSAALIRQLRTIQPDPVYVALAMRTMKDAATTARQQGFNGILVKPFDAAQIDNFLASYFSSRELVSVEDYVIKIGQFVGSTDRLPQFFNRVSKSTIEAIDNIAAACYDRVLLDSVEVPNSPEHVSRLIISSVEHAKRLGLAFQLVTNNDIRALLQSIAETADLAVFSTLEEAKQQP